MEKTVEKITDLGYAWTATLYRLAAIFREIKQEMKND